MIITKKIPNKPIALQDWQKILSDSYREPARLERISHLKRLRIHSRLPVVIPERITAELVNILRGTRLQTILVLHINHGNEIDDQLVQSLGFLGQVAGYLVPRLTRETSGRDSKIPLDLYLD